MWINDYKSFWDSFWSSLFSGSLSGLLTGIVVGLIIWRFQSNAEERQVARDIERDFSIFLQKLSLTLNLSNTISLSFSFKSFMPENILEFRALTNKSPIPYWNHSLNNKHRYKKPLWDVQKALIFQGFFCSILSMKFAF